MHFRNLLTKQLLVLIIILLIIGSANASVSFSINSSTDYTNDSNLELIISAPNNGGSAEEVKFSCDDSNWTAYEAFSETKYFDINGVTGCSVSSGTKTIYIDVNFSNNIQETANSSIIFDAVPPTITSFSQTPFSPSDGATGTTVIFALSDDTNLSSISISLDRGSTSVYDNNFSACTITGTNANCEFIDFYVDREANYTYAYVITDMSGNTTTDSNSFSFADAEPPTKPATPTGSDTNTSIYINWTANTENDLNSYAIYRSTQTGFSCNSQTFLTYSDNNYYTNSALDENTTYYYKIKAIDYSGRESIASDQNSFTTDYNLLQGPTITRLDVSCDSNEWCYDDDPQLNSYATNSQYSWILTTSSSTNPSDCSYGVDCNVASIAEYSNLANGTHYFKSKACKPTGCGPVSTYILKIDAAAPSQPSPSAVLSGDKVIISWDAVTDTGGSGLYRYIIYSSDKESFSTSNSNRLAYVDDENTSFTDGTCDEGTTCYYKVLAQDNAGNYSRDYNAPIVSQTIPTGLELTSVSTTVTNSSGEKSNYFNSANDMTLEITFSREVDDFYLYKTIDDGNTETIVDGTDEITSYEYDFVTSASYEDINFYIIASSTINDINYELHVKFDNTEPEISFLNLEEGETITGNKTIYLNATDNGEIKKVELFLNGASIGTATKNDSNYSFSLNPSGKNSGTLKAVATDGIGLTAEISQSITIDYEEENNEESTGEEGEITIESVVAKLNELNTKKNLLEEKLVENTNYLSPAMKQKKTEADALLEEAESLIESNLEQANQKTIEAQNLYAQILEDPQGGNLSILDSLDLMSLLPIIIAIMILAGAGGGVFVILEKGKLQENQEKQFNKHHLLIDEDIKKKGNKKELKKEETKKGEKTKAIKDKKIPEEKTKEKKGILEKIKGKDKEGKPWEEKY
jgi:hypothetical protein